MVDHVVSDIRTVRAPRLSAQKGKLEVRLPCRWVRQGYATFANGRSDIIWRVVKL
jgi:hypothetical protein